MFSKVKLAQLKMFCPHFNRDLTVHLRYILKDKSVYVIECNGCEEGFNGSRECQLCRDKACETFTKEVESNQ